MQLKNSVERNIVNCRLTLNGGVCQKQVRMIAEDVQFLFKSKRKEKDKTKFLICCTLQWPSSQLIIGSICLGLTLLHDGAHLYE